MDSVYKTETRASACLAALGHLHRMGSTKGGKDGPEAPGWLSQPIRRCLGLHATPSARWSASSPPASEIRGQGRLGFDPALCS